MGKKLAIFARIHKDLLIRAMRPPRGKIRFQSNRVWRTAQKEIGRIRKIYLAVIGDRKEIKYVANLIEVVFPKEDRKRGLELERDYPGDENKWKKAPKTYYLISNCKKLPKPIALEDLVKFSDKENLSPGYKYGYSIVYEHK
ncbi:MAG TPA: hypothetical protein VKS81_06175 [Bacteroidota bacterium]|nr:hypothetical protein [Bacteroidota bacterium]